MPPAPEKQIPVRQRPGTAVEGTTPTRARRAKALSRCAARPSQNDGGGHTPARALGSGARARIAKPRDAGAKMFAGELQQLRCGAS